MPNEKLSKDLLAVLSAHGLSHLQPEILNKLEKEPALPSNSGQVASYIKEIITGREMYDERILSKVGEALRTFEK